MLIPLTQLPPFANNWLKTLVQTLFPKVHFITLIWLQGDYPKTRTTNDDNIHCEENLPVS